MSFENWDAPPTYTYVSVINANSFQRPFVKFDIINQVGSNENHINGRVYIWLLFRRRNSIHPQNGRWRQRKYKRRNTNEPKVSVTNWTIQVEKCSFLCCFVAASSLSWSLVALPMVSCWTLNSSSKIRTSQPSRVSSIK